MIKGALDVNSDFFDLPLVTKEELIVSDDLFKPVRFGKVNGEGEGRRWASRL